MTPERTRLLPALLAALALGALATLTRTARAQAVPPTLLGAWRIDRVLPTQTPGCWDAAQGRKLLGTTLLFAPHSLTFAGGTEPISETLTRTLSTRRFHEEYTVGQHTLSLADLGIRTAGVTEHDLQHEDADYTGGSTEVPGDTVLLAGPGRIVISACGVYYLALRAKR